MALAGGAARTVSSLAMLGRSELDAVDLGLICCALIQSPLIGALVLFCLSKVAIGLLLNRLDQRHSIVGHCHRRFRVPSVADRRGGPFPLTLPQCFVVYLWNVPLPLAEADNNVRRGSATSQLRFSVICRCRWLENGRPQ
ncbi:Hypothetical Protein RSKD131_4267 [Cereibacter sphaeroides KD131]|nr:Hypothetical Protein RSKD131_4267 [Cereibacter sphaeroides KD131]